MLLVMLMSVTGAWAKLVGTGYTIVNSQFSLISGISGNYYKSNNSQANMVIKTNQPIFLAEVYINANVATDFAGQPDKIKIEGSIDQSAWTTIKENSHHDWENTVSVSVSDKYQYFRLTFYTSQYNSLGFTELTISEDKIEGEGTFQNPYTLNNVLHLKQYADLITEGNNAAHAKLTKDLDMSQTTFASIDNANYVGTLDGNGYSIKNLNNVSGLFKSIGAATIKNLTIENATLSATDEYSGAIASQANGTKFQNCTVKGIISASSTNVGGLVGNANGATFTQCLVLSDFTAVDCTTVGGLAGVATNNATFTECYSIGNYSVGSANAGALVGNTEGSTTFNQCYAATNLNNDGGVHLPICGNAANASFNNCYYYGTGSEMTVSKADVGSGRLAYLLNKGDYTGPYFQRIGTDAYPSLTNTGNNGYVYLALDDATYTNACPHRDCTIYPFKAPTCVGASGNVEYNQCKNSFCNCLLTPNRDVVSNVKEFTLSSKAVKIQDHPYNNDGKWNYSTSKDKGGTTYYNVMEVTIKRHNLYGGDYVITYTSVDDDPTMNFHLFFNTDIGAGSFSVRFYVNGIERSASRIKYPTSTSERHDVVTIDGLHKFDIIKVVYNYGHPSPNNSSFTANLFIGTEKEIPIPTSHNLHKVELSYNCIDGGYREYYECERCTNVFTQNTPQSDANITTLSAMTLAPVGAHNFTTTTHMEGNLYGHQCQNEHCTTFDPDKYVLKNYHNDTDLTLSYDGSTYSTTSSLSLIDAKSYVTPVAFDAPSLTYSRTFYTNVWNPWFVPFATTVDELTENGITDVACIESIHNYDTDDDGVVDKTVLEVIKKTNGTVKAGVPYMVKTGDSYTYPMTFTSREMDASTNAKTVHTETASAAYDFIGTYSGLTAGEVNAANIYSLNSEGAMAHRTGLILPQRWYMKEANKDNVYEELSPAMARAFSIRVIGEEDETTGIRTIYPEDEQTEELLPKGIFDLNGRKLSAPQSGKINIINGKKQFVR